MTTYATQSVVGVLASGGLDSSILLAHLLESGLCVQPLYVRFGLAWQEAELRALRRFMEAVDSPRLNPITVLEMPVDDLYGDHWSINGLDVPGADTPDEAVYLPGRNALLIVKAAIFCELHGIEELAMAPLESNPFPDATPDFFGDLEAVLNRGMRGRVRLTRPFGHLSKQQVMELGQSYPLELTFCCIDPRGDSHCGQCNKCAERQAAFRLIGLDDPTKYLQTGGHAPGSRTHWE
ncbi:MAG TPA: 7-cyano-7-deazaguanine synthase [Pirellulales bacterium]|nr:7-cyano-7-deazaguanine synthase [Pirellulales bacterium]